MTIYALALSGALCCKDSKNMSLLKARPEKDA